MNCNESYRALPNSSNESFAYLNCTGLDPAPGVAGHLDHALLNNARAYAGLTTGSTSARAAGHLGRLFSRWFGDSDRWTNIAFIDTITYMEADVLAHAHFSTHAIKLLVGSFAVLFGTPRGRLLQRVAAARGIALAWALGSARDMVAHVSNTSAFARKGFDARLLDASPPILDRLNASLSAGERAAFEVTWAATAAARARLPPHANGTLPEGDVRALWAQAAVAMPSARLQVPRPGACTDWDRCLGMSERGACICRIADVS